MRCFNEYWSALLRRLPGNTVTRSSRISFAILLASAVTSTASAPASAQTVAETDKKPPSRWSVALLGGYLAPVREMREGYQDALVAGARIKFTSRLGIGMSVALDYSPLPRKTADAAMLDTTYGTAALLPGYTIGKGVVRVHLSAGGGVAVENTAEAYAMPAALGQLALELHVTDGGGLMMAGGATKTFGDDARAYEYGWAMAGLKLEL
jgi:opacity protein-like surface antigen